MVLEKKQIVEYLKGCDDEFLYKLAEETREAHVGNVVYIRGLIEISNYCKNNCMYCGIRAANKKCERYRLTPEEIIDLGFQASEAGYKTIVLQGGEDNFYSVEKMQNIISEIKKFNVYLTLSLGEKTLEEYKAYKEAGADRYLLRIETTDKQLYKKMHPKMSLKKRIKCLENIKNLGYEVGTGSLIGLPQQSIESLAEDVIFFKRLESDMVGMGPFIPSDDTPLSKDKKGDFDLALRMIALTRIILPNANIPATTAIETMHKNGQAIALLCGANVVMLNVGDSRYKKLYKIYPDKAGLSGSPESLRADIEKKLQLLKRYID